MDSIKTLHMFVGQIFKKYDYDEEKNFSRLNLLATFVFLIF